MICQIDLSFSVEKKKTKDSGANQFPPQNMNFDPAYGVWLSPHISAYCIFDLICSKMTYICFLPMNFPFLPVICHVGTWTLVLDRSLIECLLSAFSFFFSVSALQKEHHSSEQPSIVVAAKEE